jgi:chemotaxis protein methyltransferase CheR
VNVEGRVAALLAAWTGIELSSTSTPALAAFLRERTHALGLTSPSSYPTALGGPDSVEFQRLVNAMTVTYTWFFRDLEQVETMRALLARATRPSLDIWIPGCASGEDAYTVALLCRELGISAQVLGTDVNSTAIAVAREGRYGEWSVRDVPQASRQYFARSSRGGFELDASVRSRVRFQVHNLLASPPLPPSGGWDLVLCRNVLMYFGKERAKLTVGTLGRVLHDEGRLLLGASDVMVEVPGELSVEYVSGRVTFRRGGVRSAFEPVPLPPLARPEATRIPDAGTVEPDAAIEARPTLLEVAHAHLMAGRLDLALSTYQTLCAADPFATEPRLFAGVAKYLAGDLQPALEAFRACLLLDEKCWPASYYLGLCYENMGLPRDALREYRRAAKQSAVDSTARDGDPRSPLHGFFRDVAWLARKRSALPDLPGASGKA